MSDSLYPHAFEDDQEPPPYPAVPSVFATPTAAACLRGPSPVMVERLSEWLPRLGTLLWLERAESPSTPPRDSLPRHAEPLGDHPACVLLARCTTVVAHSSITSHGPREWMSLFGSEGEPVAKIFLLPDSDYFAWDQMALALQLAPVAPIAHEPPTHATLLGRALSRFGSRRRARLLAFDVRIRQYTSALDARAPLRISLLGLDLARGIVSDEGAEWIAPLHAG